MSVDTLYQVEIPSGKTRIELPNGFNYSEGDVIDLTPEEYGDIVTTLRDGTGDPVRTRGLVSPLRGDDGWMFAGELNLASVTATGVVKRWRPAFDGFIRHIAVLPVVATTGSGDDITLEFKISHDGGVAAPIGATDAPANEVQTVTITAVAGTFTLTFDGETTDPLDFDASTAEVQTALRALSNIGATDVAVTGTPGAYTITFGGDLAATDVAELTVDDSALIATEAVAEVQTLTVDAAGGTFTVTWNGQTTGALAFDITAADLETALDNLSNIADGDVEVTGGPGDAGGSTPYTLTWLASLGNVAAPTTNAGSLTGGAGTAAVATTTPGVTEVAGSAVVATQTAGDPAGTPVTRQIQTADVDAQSGGIVTVVPVPDANAAFVATDDEVVIEATTVTAAFNDGTVLIVLVGDTGEPS